MSGPWATACWHSTISSRTYGLCRPTYLSCMGRPGPARWLGQYRAVSGHWTPLSKARPKWVGNLPTCNEKLQAWRNCQGRWQRAWVWISKHVSHGFLYCVCNNTSSKVFSYIFVFLCWELILSLRGLHVVLFDQT